MLLDMEQIAVTLTDGSIEEHGPDSDPEYAWGCMQDTASGDLIIFKYRDGPLQYTSLVIRKARGRTSTAE